jgi:type IV secretion system protein VirB1
MIDLLLISMCSTPGVHPKTTWEIIRHESAYNELAININSKRVTLENLGLQKPRTKEEGRLALQKLLEMKVNFDAGVMQVNSVNFKAYRLDAGSALDPCSNIRAGTAILKNFYQSAEKSLGSGQQALRAALSAYNTGNHSAGFENGYVAKFYGKRIPYQENPYKASIMALSNELPRPRKNPYSASIIPPNLDEGEKSHDPASN